MPYVFNPFTGSFDDTVPLSGGKISSEYLPASSLASIEDLPDVDFSDPVEQNGKALIYLDGKWIPGPILGPKNTNTDPFYNQVELLLHFDGNNGGTSFVDSSANNFLLNRLGSLTTSTTKAKFGGTSGYFPGTSYVNSDWTGTNSGLQIPNAFNSVFALPGDFTIECWVNTRNGKQTQAIINAIDFTADTGWNFELSYGKLRFYYQYDGSTAIRYHNGVALIPDRQWAHIAIVRSGNTFSSFINGTFDVSSSYSDTIKTPTLSTGILVGTYTTSATPSSQSFGDLTYGGGYIDDLRITIGTARYTPGINFTPPDKAFPEVAASGNGKIDYLLDYLDDVDVSTATNNQALVYNATTELWSPGTVATSAQGALADTALQPTSSINALADVDTATAAPTSGQALSWDGSNFVPTTVVSPTDSINALADVDLEAEHTAPLGDGRALIYVNGKWQAGPVVGGYQYNTGNDPLSANVVFGSSFDTNYLDETGYWDQVSTVLTATTFGTPGPVISTADKKYGTGSSYANAVANYVKYTSTTHGSAFSFGTGDFCIEGWFRDVQGYGGRGLFYFSSGSSFDIVLAGSLSINGAVYALANQAWPGGWVHVAVVRESGTIKVYQNGVEVISVAASTNFNGATFDFRLGYANPASPYYWYGYIDDIRITKGAARYTTNFTPPAGAILGANVIGPYSIDNLDDVDITTAAPSVGQALAWDGSDFVPTTVVSPTDSINVLADVDTATAAPTNGQALVWDGTNFVPNSVSASFTSNYSGDKFYYKIVSTTAFAEPQNPGEIVAYNSNSVTLFRVWPLDRNGDDAKWSSAFTINQLVPSITLLVNDTSITYTGATYNFITQSGYYQFGISGQNLFAVGQRIDWVNPNINLAQTGDLVKLQADSTFKTQRGSLMELQDVTSRLPRITGYTYNVNVTPGSSLGTPTANGEFDGRANTPLLRFWPNDANGKAFPLDDFTEGRALSTDMLTFVIWVDGVKYTVERDGSNLVSQSGYYQVNMSATAANIATFTAIQNASEIIIAPVFTEVDKNQANDALVWNNTLERFEPTTVVTSQTLGITGASAITNIVQLSQASYDAIVTPDPSTLYVIV